MSGWRIVIIRLFVAIPVNQSVLRGLLVTTNTLWPKNSSVRLRVIDPPTSIRTSLGIALRGIPCQY